MLLISWRLFGGINFLSGCFTLSRLYFTEVFNWCNFVVTIESESCKYGVDKPIGAFRE